MSDAEKRERDRKNPNELILRGGHADEFLQRAGLLNNGDDINNEITSLQKNTDFHFTAEKSGSSGSYTFEVGFSPKQIKYLFEASMKGDFVEDSLLAVILAAGQELRHHTNFSTGTHIPERILNSYGRETISNITEKEKSFLINNIKLAVNKVTEMNVFLRSVQALIDEIKVSSRVLTRKTNGGNYREQVLQLSDSFQAAIKDLAQLRTFFAQKWELLNIVFPPETDEDNNLETFAKSSEGMLQLMSTMHDDLLNAA